MKTTDIRAQSNGSTRHSVSWVLFSVFSISDKKKCPSVFRMACNRQLMQCKPQFLLNRAAYCTNKVHKKFKLQGQQKNGSFCKIIVLNRTKYTSTVSEGTIIGHRTDCWSHYQDIKKRRALNINIKTCTRNRHMDYPQLLCTLTCVEAQE